MRITRRAATLGLLAALATPAIAEEASRRVRVPTRGFNMPDWLALEPRVPTDTVLAKLRERGFETIRLPIDPAIVTPDFLPQVAAVLDSTTRHGFNAILDLHPSAADPDMIEGAWRLLAPVLADTSPDMVYAELLNEPPFEPARWTGLRDKFASIVRAAAPAHAIIWGPASVQGIWELDGSPPLSDHNAIVAIHYYWPMGFTHQGQNWYDSPLARIADLPFPANVDDPAVKYLLARLDTVDRVFLREEFRRNWTIKHIADDFAEAAAWSVRHKIPMMLGEFGVLNFSVDPTSRANWIRAVRAAAEDNDIGWAHWELDQGFGLIADRTSTDGFDVSIMEALLG